MSIPTKAKLYRPILEIVCSTNESLSDKQIAVLLSDRFNLTDAERRTMIPSGVQSTIENRTTWAVFDLKDAGLMHYPSPGRRAITRQGREFLGSHDGEITNAHLCQYKARSQHAGANKTEDAVDDSFQTPEELMERSAQQIQEKLADEVLEKITALSPERFEHLVVNLLEKMGYGKGQQVGAAVTAALMASSIRTSSAWRKSIFRPSVGLVRSASQRYAISPVVSTPKAPRRAYLLPTRLSAALQREQPKTSRQAPSSYG